MAARPGHPGGSVLRRPRLLPLTIVAMAALLAVKSITLVQAAAEETGRQAAPDVQSPSPASGRPSPASMAPSVIAPAMASEATGIGPGPAAGPATPPSPPVSEAERAVLLDLRHRRDMLDAKARALDERGAEIDAADHRLAERVQELSALQTRLESLEAGRRQHNAENWAGLVKVYEAMKPRDAATIFDVLDMQVLLQVLDRMQERRAAPVLAAMQPDRARLATQLLAEMRTRAVTPPSPSPAGDTKG